MMLVQISFQLRTDGVYLSVPGVSLQVDFNNPTFGEWMRLSVWRYRLIGMPGGAVLQKSDGGEPPCYTTIRAWGALKGVRHESQV